MKTRKKSTFTLVKETPANVDPSHDGREIQKEELLTRIGNKRIQHIILNGYCTNSRPIPKQTFNHFNQYESIYSINMINRSMQIQQILIAIVSRILLSIPADG